MLYAAIIAAFMGKDAKEHTLAQEALNHADVTAVHGLSARNPSGAMPRPNSGPVALRLYGLQSRPEQTKGMV